MELGWWLEGPCECSIHAVSENVSINSNYTGCRCRCNDGFIGDGFSAGYGCNRVPVSGCSASRYASGDCEGATRLGALIGGVIAGASLMATMAIICHCIKKRSKLKKQMSTNRLIYEAAGTSTVPFFPYKEIQRATNGFSDNQRLGTGAYGTVYAGKLHSISKWVAVKKIRHRDSDGVEQIINEIKLLSSVSHQNLVHLLGCCIENGEQILVYEFMPNGTLSQHLQRERGKPLPWIVRLTVATETARAIAHLHSLNPPIFHRDIKSSNILLDDNFNSKVADFGLSRLGMPMPDESHISTAPQGTPGYVDPQYHQNFHLSDKSDVYSFGVVLVEIITGLKVVDFSRSNTEINLASLATERIGKGRLDEIIDPFLEPHEDPWVTASIHKLAELAFRCLAFYGDMRPTMMEVAEELEQLINSGSEKLIVGDSTMQNCRRLIDYMPTILEIKDSSPVSVQDPWSSDSSSPSTNSLLSNVAP
jgi:serine/threonine protein kinase